MGELNDLRVAIAHHWFAYMRGGEKVAEAIGEVFPDAPLYALMADRGVMTPSLLRHPLRTSFLQTLTHISGSHRHWLPLFPRAAESLDATEFDLVICSDAATMKGIRTRCDAIKVCYCHSPMRYVWEQTEDYLDNAALARRVGLKLFSRRLRQWDHAAAQTVSVFIANSKHTADRIQRCYGRAATVIHPPVRTNFPPPLPEPGDFYLVVGEQVEYKRNDLAVEACLRLRRNLVVIGDGPVLRRLRAMADEVGSMIVFLGRQPDEVLRDCYRRCRALLFCGQEDFGIVPLEAMAAGRPVIAYGRGGALETVVPGETGVLFDSQDPACAVDAIERFESQEAEFAPERIQRHARQFSYEAFHKDFGAFLRRVVMHG
jgi:glycosyltransferase involved in cell wall biosynthesis